MQSGFDDTPLRAVDHQRHLADGWLTGDETEVGGHRDDGVEHAFVHVDVDHLGTTLHLLPRHVECGLVVTSENQFRELCRPGDVGALADVDEIRGAIDDDRLQSAQAQRRGNGRHHARCNVVHGGGDGTNVRGCTAATATDDVHVAGARPLTDDACHVIG